VGTGEPVLEGYRLFELAGASVGSPVADSWDGEGDDSVTGEVVGSTTGSKVSVALEVGEDDCADADTVVGLEDSVGDTRLGVPDGDIVTTTTEGAAVGVTVGDFDGAAVTMLEGALVGDSVGRSVGDFVGSTVGGGTGLAVG
jgi:hypothetical protein